MTVDEAYKIASALNRAFKDKNMLEGERVAARKAANTILEILGHNPDGTLINKHKPPRPKPRIAR
jgi:hypothetical protein